MGELTYLNKVAGALRDAANWLDSIGDWFENIPIIGDPIHWWFHFVASGLNTAAAGADDAQRLIDAAMTLASDIWTSLGFGTMMSAVWTAWKDIRDFPASWIWGHVREWSLDIQNFLDFPATWVADKLGVWATWFWSFLTNRNQWFKDWMQASFTAIKKFIDDPLGYVKKLLTDDIVHLSSLFDTPVDWLKARIEETLGIPHSAWLNPLAWAFEAWLNYIEDWFLTYWTWMYRLSERVLRYFWERVW